MRRATLDIQRVAEARAILARAYDGLGRARQHQRTNRHQSHVGITRPELRACACAATNGTHMHQPEGFAASQRADHFKEDRVAGDRQQLGLRTPHPVAYYNTRHATYAQGSGSPGACNAPSELAMLAVPCRTAERHGAALALPHAATPASACEYGRQHSRNGAVHAVARQRARLGSSQ